MTELNANRWPLDEMDQVQYDIALPLDECHQRLETLHEPRRRVIFVHRYIRYQARTLVAVEESTNTSLLYCVQRVHRMGGKAVRQVYAEANVRLEATPPGTRVTLYFGKGMTLAQRWWILGHVLTVLLLLATSFISLFTPDGFSGEYLPLILIPIGWYYLIDVRHFRHQQTTLKSQLYMALGLP